MLGFDVHHTGYNPSPAVVNGIVYIGSFDKRLHAYDASTGEELWAFHTGGIILSSPTVKQGVAYIGSEDGSLYALNALTGDQLWSTPTVRPITSSPTVYRGAVYFGSGRNLYKVDGADGSVIWTAQTGDQIALSSPAVGRGAVYVGSRDDNLWAFNATTGEMLWSAPMGGNVDDDPVVSGGLVYASAIVDSITHGPLSAFNASTGKLVWTARVGNGYGEAIANGVIYYSSGAEHAVIALDASTGARLWSRSTRDAATSRPTIANGLVYVGAGDGNVYALDSVTGHRRWVAPTVFLKPILSSLSVVNGSVYFGSFDNSDNVYAYHLP